MRDTIKRKISGFAYGMALMAVIIFIAIILIEPFVGRRYYSISKEQLVKMENRIIKIKRLVDDAKYDVSSYSDTYDTLEEIEDDADKLLDYIYQVYDDDANN